MKHFRTYNWIKVTLFLILGLISLDMTSVLWSIESDIYQSSTTKKGNKEVTWCGYWPQEVKLNGKLMEATAFGSPNYGETPKTDKTEKYYYIILDAPINIKGDKKMKSPNSTETEQNVAEVQLVINWMHEKDIIGSGNFKKMMHKKVIVSGTLFHSSTGHHHKKVLIAVTKLEFNK